jgi:hypothetical protein
MKRGGRPRPAAPDTCLAQRLSMGLNQPILSKKGPFFKDILRFVSGFGLKSLPELLKILARYA